MTTYSDTIKKMKAKHKEYSELGREYRRQKIDSIHFFGRAIKAAAENGLMDRNDYNQPVVIKSRKRGVWYNIYPSETGATCFLINKEPRPSAAYDTVRSVYPVSGNIKTIVSRLKKVDDCDLYDRVASLLKFLENYSE